MNSKQMLSVNYRIEFFFIFLLKSKKLSDNLETTVQKLEESRQLLKTNENGKF